MPPGPKPKPPVDPFLAKLDSFAETILAKAQSDDVGFRDKLDAFKELAGWVRIKKGLTDAGDGRGGSLAELKQQLHETNGAAYSGKASTRSQRLSRAQQTRFHGRPNLGGPALDAIKHKIPGSGVGGDDGGAGNGAVRTSVGVAGSIGGVHPGDDGDERPE